MPIKIISLILTFVGSLSQAHSFWNPNRCLETLSSPLQFVDSEIPTTMIAVDAPLLEMEDSSLKRPDYKIIRDSILRLDRQRVVKVVVYPMSGLDINTPFEVFSKAEVVIGLDSHPFIAQLNSPSQSLTLESLRAGSGPEIVREGFIGGFSLTLNIDKATNLSGSASFLIARLRLGFPQARILRVRAFNDPLASRAGDGPEFDNGEIEFDLGPNTAVRKYIHLRAQIDGTESYKNNWWFSRLDALPIRGVISKAGHGNFERLRREGQASKVETLPNFLISALNTNDGFLVDDGLRLPSPEVGLVYKTRYLDVEKFGYLVNGARVTKFNLSLWERVQNYFDVTK